MRIRNPYLLAGIFAFVFISCQKEASVELPNNSPGNSGGNGGNGGSGGSSSGSEIGTWKLISLHVSSTQSVESKAGSDAINAVTVSDYTTENNTGTLKFDGSNCITTGLGYTVNTTSTTTMYLNGAPGNTFPFPFSVAVPPTDGTSPYKKIGTDSLYFQTGLLSTVNSGGTVQNTAAGYKLRYYGTDSMTMTSVYDDVQLIISGGTSAKSSFHAVIVGSLKKQ